MRTYKSIFIVLCLVVLVPSLLCAQSATDAATLVASPYQVTPLPNQIVINKGVLVLPLEGTTFYAKGGTTAGLADYISASDLKAKGTSHKSTATIVISIAKTSTDDEGYNLRITPKQVQINAQSEAGAFYAVQTLLQMAALGNGRLQCCAITDRPSMRYRGLMFDVSRHFRPKEFLKKQLDAMALFKLNRMHLHLTDGAGWRIQIDKYPRLTNFAAWRPQRKWSDWNANGKLYCSQKETTAYGGYYTKEDIREIVQYAAQRHIVVIPEIEMPGHSEEVTATYPELSCSGKAYTDYDLCAGKEATFLFLQDVIDEIIDLFPSHYIHIGGDEAGKSGWKKCPDCQKRMKDLHLNDVDQLQSYFIHRIEKYVNSRGRQIIGWDEILEGGLTPNATVMSWRGTEGGIKAIDEGHDAIMTPGEYCYLDYTQDAPFKEPASIGGYTPLRLVYSYNPAQTLTPQQQKHLLGIQGNLWSEYIPDDSHAEYMYYPRAFAIAETGWTKAELKDYDKFYQRAVDLCQLLTAKGYHTFDLANEYGNRPESKQTVNHLARGCKVVYNKPYSDRWPAQGETTLTDGVQGGWTYTDHRWQGSTNDMDVTIDLGAVKEIHYIGANFMHAPGPWVWAPERVEYYVSTDGKDFQQVGSVCGDMPDVYDGILFKQYSIIHNGQARYVRMVAHKNHRDGAWLFTDEVVVN